MLMTVIGRDPSASIYGELAGVRVLITGLSPDCGVDVARSFRRPPRPARRACHGQRSPRTTCLTTLLAETASEVKLFTDACRDSDAAIRFAQTAAQAFGGLDVVINLIPITRCRSQEPREHRRRRGSRRRRSLCLPLLVTRIVANRMRLTLNEGLVLNVMTMPAPRTAGEAALAGVARTALAAVTRGEAADVGAARHPRQRHRARGDDARGRRLPRQRARHRRARALSRLASAAARSPATSSTPPASPRAAADQPAADLRPSAARKRCAARGCVEPAKPARSWLRSARSAGWRAADPARSRRP